MNRTRGGRWVDWLDERTSVRAAWRFIADEPIPGGARLRYVFGSVSVYLFVQQVVLGILLATYYSPSATDAWASTVYLNDRVSMGWLLRGLHHHAASAMVIVMLLHLGQVVVARAYARPREVNWLTGLALGALVLAFSLSGYLLPWDQKGYWATKVATNLIGSIPGGGALQSLVQGGTAYGNLTLTRFYALHVFVLPLGFGFLLAIHVWLVRKHGITPPSIDAALLTRTTEAFFPRQLFFDTLGMTVTAAALFGVTLSTHGAALSAPAQPASTFAARPEWYFLPLFELLKIFDGRFELVASVALPVVATLLFVAVPWIDRATRGSRRAVLGIVAALISGSAVLGMIAVVQDRRDPAYQRGLAAAEKEAQWARSLAAQGVPPAGGEAVFENDPAVHARRLFKEHCTTCHAIDGIGADKAPDFIDYGSRRWLFSLIRNPTEHRFYGGTKHHTEMEPFGVGKIRDADLHAIVEYVASISSDPALGKIDPALAARGEALFDRHDCTNCHETDGKMGNDGPNLKGRGSRAWVARVIANPAEPALFGNNAQMPAFGDKLSSVEIAQLAALIVSQR